jgi:hypothetical protein
MRSAPGEQGLSLILSYGALAQVYEWQGHFGAAEHLLRKALGQCAAAGQACGIVRARLACVLVESGQPERGLALARGALGALQESGADRGFAHGVEGLALVLLHRPLEAETAARQALRELEQVERGPDWRVSYGQLALGAALAEQGKDAEAGPLLRQARSFFARFEAETGWHEKMIRRCVASPHVNR